MTTTQVILVAILTIVIIAVLAIYSADKKKRAKAQVVVPDGEFYLIRRSYGKFSSYHVVNAGETYLPHGGEKMIALKGKIDRFMIEYPNKFVNCQFARMSSIRVKVDVRAECSIVDLEKFFAFGLSSVQEVVGFVAYSACRMTKLNDLLRNGLNKKIVDDAILEYQREFMLRGVKISDLRISNVRDAYDKDVVSNMRRQMAGGQPSKNEPHYPTLDESVASEMDKL